MSIKGRSSTKGKRPLSDKPRGGFFGYAGISDLFKSSADSGRLSHSYIFFGEKGVGKFNFALRLADYLEFGSFEESKTPRSESMVIKPAEGGSIGIDVVRDARYFLSQQPAASNYRTVIVDEADTLTDQAQNALLKISEEPPPHGLVILVVANPESLLSTLQSRFQKIYFPRLARSLISKHLQSSYGLEAKTAEGIAAYSFGRMGRAIRLALGEEETKSARKDVLEILKTGDSRILASALENPVKLNNFIEEMIAELAKHPEDNLTSLKELLRRSVLNAELNTNKRLQLEAVLWSI